MLKKLIIYLALSIGSFVALGWYLPNTYTVAFSASSPKAPAKLLQNLQNINTWSQWFYWAKIGTFTVQDAQTATILTPKQNALKLDMTLVPDGADFKLSAARHEVTGRIIIQPSATNPNASIITVKADALDQTPIIGSYTSLFAQKSLYNLLHHSISLYSK